MRIRYTVFDNRKGMHDGWCIWDNQEKLFVKRTGTIGRDAVTDGVLTFDTRRQAREYARSLNSTGHSTNLGV